MRRPGFVIVGFLAMLALFLMFGRALWMPWFVKVSGGRTVAKAVAVYAEVVEPSLVARVEGAGVGYPPPQIALLGLKAERALEVWARDSGAWRFIRRYDVLAASGTAGPKLREGDRQVPEGVYRVSGLNPNSRFHLSMQIDYPNAFDRARAVEDGRTELGGEIFIHGSDVSIGCLAIGDEAIEELFLLVSRVGREHVTVLIAPRDPRVAPLTCSAPGAPKWLPALYDSIAKEFAQFR